MDSIHQMQKSSRWIPTNHQDSAVLGGVGVRGKDMWGGGHTTAKQKIFRALPLCKERRHSRVKDFEHAFSKLIHFVGMAMPVESEHVFISLAGFPLAHGSAWGGGS